MESVFIVAETFDGGYWSEVAGSINPDTGEYTIEGLSPDREYLVWAHTHGIIDGDNGAGALITQYYDGAYTEDDARRLTPNGHLTGIDLTVGTVGVGELALDLSGSAAVLDNYDGMYLRAQSRVPGVIATSPLEFVGAASDLPVTLKNVPAGPVEIVVYLDVARVTQHLGGNHHPGTGTVIDVIANETTEASLPFPQAGSITGKASYQDPSKAQASEVDILVYVKDAKGEWDYIRCTDECTVFASRSTEATSPSGFFEVRGLAPGEYKVGFRPYYDGGYYLGDPAYQGDEPDQPTIFYGGPDLESAKVLSVTANQKIGNVNAVLPITCGGCVTSNPKPTPVDLVDVSSNKNSKNYTQFHTQIQWLANSGITKGWNVGGGKHEFRAKDEITREAMAAFMYRYAGSPAVKLPAKSPFADVSPKNTNFYKEIIWMNQQGISTGWSVAGGKKEFRPKDNITRDAMAAFMYRFAGKPKTTPPATSPFVDVPKSSQFYKEVTWLSNAGISTGWKQSKGKPQYRPYDEISREAMAAFLYRLDRL